MKCPLVHRFKFRELVSQQGHKATRLFIPPTFIPFREQLGIQP